MPEQLDEYLAEEYPELYSEYNISSIKRELDDWHAFFNNEFLQEGKWISGETTEDVEKDFRNRDQMAVELVKEILPQIVERWRTRK